MHLRRAAVAVAISIAALAGCGDDGKARPADDSGAVATAAATDEAPGATTSESVDPALPSNEDLNRYFEAIASQDVGQLKKASALAGRGSIAEAFLGYQVALLNALVDGGAGGQLQPEELSETDDGFESCPADGSDCTEFANIEGRDGKIVNFTVNGKDIAPRLAAGDGRPVQAGGLGSATFLYSYQATSSDQLFVLLQVASKGEPITAAGYESTYRSSAGRQSTASDMMGPTDLGAESKATLALIFPGARPGGDVSLSFYSSDFMNEEVVTFPTR